MSRQAFRLVATLLSALLSLAAVPAAACPADQWRPPADTGGTGVQQLLRPIPLGTRWADVPSDVKARLQWHAEHRLAAFRARWGAEALRQKQAILLDCPTAEMTAAMDDFYQVYTSMPGTISLGIVENAALKRALVGHYLGSLAALRASASYYTSNRLPDLDWDGVSPFDSMRLPDRQAYADIKAFNAGIVAQLRAIKDAALDDGERALKQRVLFDARAFAVGAFTGESHGIGEMENACALASFSNDVVLAYKAAKGRPRGFASDDAVMRELNAVYLHSTRLKWVDVGSVAVVLGSHSLCNAPDDELEAFIGKPADNEVAKGIVQLRGWWFERLSSTPEARNKCSVYSAQDRAEIWEAFSADQRTNSDGTASMETFRAQLDRFREGRLRFYREAAKQAVGQVFPDDLLLTPAQRRRVVASIESEPAFARFVAQVAAALDAAQGTVDGPAAARWKKVVEEKVVYFDGGYAKGASVRPEDERALRAMYEDVKTWLAAQYRGYPIDVASLFDKFTLTVTPENGAITSSVTGNIRLGIGLRRNRMEVYGVLLHEIRHAVEAALRATAADPSSVMTDQGLAIEGSGVAADYLLIEPFMRQHLNDDIAYALYALDYGRRDARIVAGTDATLQKYFRAGCSEAGDPDGLAFARDIARGYGLPTDAAASLALRAQIGTQYLQYVAGGMQVMEDIAWLQAEIDPTGKARVDPFILFACGLNNPERDADYVADLKACMKR